MQIAKYWRNKKLRYRLIRMRPAKPTAHVTPRPARHKHQAMPPPQRKIAEPVA